MATTNTATKTLLGATVVLTADLADLFGLDGNVLYEVADSRCTTPYTFTIAPILERGLDAARAITGLAADDFRVVSR